MTLPKQQVQPDPLYVIFEEHLYNFQDSDADRKTFIGNIVVDYLTYLRKQNIIVPKAMESAVFEELGAQVNRMLVKKIYGCLTIDDYRKDAGFEPRRKARKRYSKLTAK